MSISSLLSAFTLILLSSSLTAQKSTELFPAKASGWKQAGPGSFSIKDGIATSEGGMGMWWYAGKSYQNATFDIEFQLPDHKWNSGIFVRFPNPGKDPWVAIRQGYECQVSGDKPGKLSTGAIYDIQTASHITLKKPGEWNHYQITTIGNLIIIAINGELVNVYTAQQGRGEKEGYIGLQNHDPISKVNYRKVSVREWSADATLNGVLAKLNITRADWVRYHAKKSKSSHWTDKADLGPAWANTFGDYYQGKHRVSALKGLSLQLSQAHQIRGLYNTETMQLHSAHRGGLEWGGTPWTGRHGTYVTMANSKTTIMQTRANRPAWADSDGSFADTRSHKGHGNFPENHLRFNGHFRNGSQVILDYSVLGSRVLETLTATSRGDQAMAFRQFDLAPSAQKRTMIVADEQGAHVSMSKDGKSAVISKQPVKQESETPVAQPGKITIVKDCTRKAWSDLSMGAPSNKDLVDRSKNKTDYFRVLPKFLPTHARGGDEEGVAVRLNDGQSARNDDDVNRSFFFEDKKKPGRIEMAFSQQRNLTRIHIYSHHKGDRSPQDIQVYAASESTADSTLPEEKLKAGGWRKLAAYHTRDFGDGGKHGVAILAPENSTLGSIRKLLFICRAPRGGAMHTFFSEIDIYGENPPKLAPLAIHKTHSANYHVHLKGENATFRDGGDGTILLDVSPSKTPTHISLGYTASQKDSAAELAKLLVVHTPAPRELVSLTKGGASLYPETIVTQGSVSKENRAWVTDRVGLPNENPWHMRLRPGGFDFFPGGDSAALSTWEGDVWVVSGLKGDFKEFKWRRYATGLFETLGLTIVDGVVYVHGRDQITRLHDQNNDGEADWYECFNNDVLITKNFHEFAFSLQTDNEGNFYFTKGAPVLPGGRGFDKILPHNGTIMRISKEGKNLEVLATGLRAPGGLGIGPNGEMTTGENEGTWQPCCKLNYVYGRDKFFGTEDTAQHLKGQKMHLPLCYFPMSIDNSGGGQVWTPEKTNWGLKPGELIHLSYGQSTLYRVLKQEVNGQMQGGVVRIPAKLHSSAMRARFHSDGSLYVLGFRGWQTNAATPQAFQRVRYTGKDVTIPDALTATEKGLYIRFEKKLDPATATDRFSYNVRRWKYIRGPQYGSGEFSIDKPDLKAEKRALTEESKKFHHKRDQVEVASVTLLENGKTVFLHIPTMKPAEQMSIRYKFKFHDQSAAEGEISNTVHNLAPHTNDAHIKKTDAVAAAPKNLKPGLEQVITSQQAEDRRVVRLPAIYVGKGDNPTDMIAGHGAFPFTSKWVGYLNIAARITPRFSLSGVGQATLKIDGKKVLKLNGKFDGKISDPIQLDPGAHQFELIYLSQRESGKHNAAQVRTLWQAEGIPLQSIPPKHFKHQPNKTLAQALAVRHGRDLVLQQNCTQCHHDANKSPLPELLQQGPDLTGIGGRAQAGWLAQWLATPHALKPGTTMPAFVDASTKQGKQDAADMAAYLASLQGEKLTDVAFGKDDAKLGGNRFHMLGCAACHTLPSKPFDAQGKRTPLNNIHTKFTPASLVAFLKDPNKYHQTIKMPDFQLGDEEARQLAAYLHVGSNGKGNEATELPSIGDAARGKQLIGKHNCAECHQGVAAASTKLPDFTAVLGKSWLKHGCASADKPSATPKLNLTKEERVSLEAYRAALAGRHIGTLAHTSSYDYAERQFKLLNCNACHARDDQASLLAKYHSDSKHLTKGIPEDHRFKVDQSRPHMTYIGEMLHTDYLQDMLGGKVKERARPWLAMRMPAFHNQNDLMARGLAAQHGMEPSKVDTANLDPQKVEAGKKLIGSSGGFACTICHANGQAKALAAFEVEGVNFDRVARRLRGGYYHRWMENPQSVTSNTKMPRYTTGNKSPLPDYNGDAQKQFDAIMEYFKSLEK